MKSNLIFIGMPAVGKSTVGIVVAKRLGRRYIGIDNEEEYLEIAKRRLERV